MVFFGAAVAVLVAFLGAAVFVLAAGFYVVWLQNLTETSTRYAYLLWFDLKIIATIKIRVNISV
jgi:hypothetical protein